MKIKNALHWVGLITLACFAGLTVEAAKLPMPPSFNLTTDAQVALGYYPLGVVDKQAAFSHHGKAHRFVTLPNGKEGWIYEYHLDRNLGHRTFTLVFGDKGVVIDVLYNEPGSFDGLSALQVQRRVPGADKARKKGFPDVP